MNEPDDEEQGQGVDPHADTTMSIAVRIVRVVDGAVLVQVGDDPLQWLHVDDVLWVPAAVSITES